MLSKVKQHQSKGRELAKSIGLNQTEITSLENKAHDAVGGAAASATGTSYSSNKSSNSDSSTDSITQPSDTEKKSDK
jgi:hypothetical protein